MRKQCKNVGQTIQEAQAGASRGDETRHERYGGQGLLAAEEDKTNARKWF
jgi:hypothetical protein